MYWRASRAKRHGANADAIYQGFINLDRLAWSRRVPTQVARRACDAIGVEFDLVTAPGSGPQPPRVA